MTSHHGHENESLHALHMRINSRCVTLPYIRSLNLFDLCLDLIVDFMWALGLPQLFDWHGSLTTQEDPAAWCILQRTYEDVLLKEVLDVLKGISGGFGKEDVDEDGHGKTAEPEEKVGAVGDFVEHDGRKFRDGEREKPVDCIANDVSKQVASTNGKRDVPPRARPIEAVRTWLGATSDATTQGTGPHPTQ